MSTELPDQARSMISAPPPETTCSQHSAARVVIVGAYIKQAKSVACWFECPLCAVSEGIASPEAIYDGDRWRTGADLPASFRAVFRRAFPALTKASRADPEDIWAAVSAGADERWSDTTRLRGWVYCLRHPDLDPAEATGLLVRASVIQDPGHATAEPPDPLDQEPDALRALVRVSRQRWLTFMDAVWQQLTPSTRDSLAALRARPDGDVTSDQLASLPAPCLDELNEVLDGMADGWNGEWPTGGDLSAWGRRVNDYRRNDHLRGLAGYATQVGHPVPDPSPLIDPLTQPRFGPRTAELENLLGEIDALSELQRTCLRQATIDRWRSAHELEPADDGWSRAFWALTDAYQVRQLDWATWNQFVAFDRLFPDDSALQAVVSDAAMSVMADGFIEPDVAEHLGVLWRTGLAAAEIISAAGPQACEQALALAPGWEGDVDELVRAATAGR